MNWKQCRAIYSIDSLRMFILEFLKEQAEQGYDLDEIIVGLEEYPYGDEDNRIF